MPDTMQFEAFGRLHLMLDDKRHSIKFVNEEGTPFTTMFLVTDDLKTDRHDISRYRNAKITVTIEFEGKEYTKRIS